MTGSRGNPAKTLEILKDPWHAWVFCHGSCSSMILARIFVKSWENSEAKCLRKSLRVWVVSSCFAHEYKFRV
jgi:hypothetical protein